VIEIQQVTKRFHTLVALDSVSLTVREGEVLGVLGPNGAGKTTLFRLIAGFLQPDAGIIRPTGPRWPAIGYKPERLLFPPKMRVGQYLKLVARLSNVPGGDTEAVVRQALAQVKLAHAVNKRIRDCSKGMRQRVGLAQSLLGDPPLILLDEPTNGLDPEGQQDIQDQIRALHGLGKCVVLSSHQLPEVTAICTDLAILNEGQVHYRNTMAAALREQPHTRIIVDDDLAPLRRLLESLHTDIEIRDRELVLNRDAMRMRRQFLSLLVSAGYDVLQMDQRRITLAEIYAETVR
jgi:ABC-2 type transport system ATP-binding protein